MTHNNRQENALERGLNIEEFESFCEFAQTNPADVQFELEANGLSEGRAVHTTAKTGPYTLGGQRIDRSARQYIYHIGAHKEVEGALGFTAPTDRPEATEVVLAALTGCINAVVSTSALKRGIVLNHLETRVRIGWNPYVFLHLEDPDSNGTLRDQFGDLQVELVIDGENITAEDNAYLRESIERSAVYNLLRLGHACSPTIVHASETIAA